MNTIERAYPALASIEVCLNSAKKILSQLESSKKLSKPPYPKGQRQRPACHSHSLRWSFISRGIKGVRDDFDTHCDRLHQRQTGKLDHRARQWRHHRKTWQHTAMLSGQQIYKLSEWHCTSSFCSYHKHSKAVRPHPFCFLPGILCEQPGTLPAVITSRHHSWHLAPQQVDCPYLGHKLRRRCAQRHIVQSLVVMECHTVMPWLCFLPT